MEYFEGLETESEIKARFKSLCKRLHPDAGGNTAEMIELKAQYEKALSGEYQRQKKSLSEIDELLKKDKLASEALEKIIMIQGVIVELCGSWIWITGDTKAVKDVLKSAGFFWAKKKLAWYWRPPEEKCKKWRRGKLSLDEIRARHGSTAVKSKPRQAIA